MKLFISYLKDNILYMLAIVLVLVIFHLTLFLYQLNLEIILYADILSLMVLVIMLGVSFYKYRRKYQELSALENNILYTQAFPKINSLLDIKYQAMIKELSNELNVITDHKNKEYQALVDYYTLWVHQIKTPIAAMHLILAEKDDIDLKVELLKIEQYVEMVLSYLRLNTKTNDYLFETIDLDKCIRETIKGLAPIFIRKKIKIDYKTINYSFISDEKWFCFGFSQILSNALKYSKSNSSIQINLKDNILIVEDKGIGIKKEDLPRIFEKGYSGYVGRSDKKATGIGLYLTKTIMDRLNHRIWIESKELEGTKVYIDLKQIKTIYE